MGKKLDDPWLMMHCFFQGTNADQDNRFSDKEKKLLKTMKFDDNLSSKVLKKCRKLAQKF